MNNYYLKCYIECISDVINIYNIHIFIVNTIFINYYNNNHSFYYN